MTGADHPVIGGAVARAAHEAARRARDAEIVAILDEGATLRVAAEAAGLSRERVRQIHARALSRRRHPTALPVRRLCGDRFHDARSRDDTTNKARDRCPTCHGTWVDYGALTPGTLVVGVFVPVGADPEPFYRAMGLAAR